MEAPGNLQVDTETQAQLPLLDQSETLLDEYLQRLDTFLCLFGFKQSSLLGCLLSWLLFCLMGIVIPVAILKFIDCSLCEKLQIVRFELCVLVSQSALAAVSLVCVSHNLRKYGIRKFLFVDRYHGQMIRFRKEYAEKIKGFFAMLLWWILPCFLVKAAREIFRFAYIQHESLWVTVGLLVALLISWTYLTTIFLAACALFNLVCNLQVIHFEDYAKLLERDSNVLIFLEEHLRLRHQLSKISHRFRINLLLALLVVTASQFVTLLQTTGHNGIINFLNAGDSVVSSFVQVVGVIVCLHGAAKISHRAQGIGSVASTWHALLTCDSTEASEPRMTDNVGNVEVDPVRSIFTNDSESDLESLDSITLPTNMQLRAYLSSYHKRQALVLYLQSNPGGITIFGWTVDRGLINTLFFIELSLVLWVLGKTIVFTSK